MTVLALPESTPEFFARRSTLHISSVPVVSPLMLSLYNFAEFYASRKYSRIQLALERKCSFAWLLLPPTSAPMLFDRDPIPLNLYLGATLRFLKSSFCIPQWIQLLQPNSLFQWCALMPVCYPTALEDKESICCWPWQVPSVLVGLDAQSFHVVQFTFRPLSECHWEAEDHHAFACDQFRC